MHAPSTRLRGHTASVLCLATSAAAATSASASPLLLSGSSDCTVRLWDLRAAKAVRCIARQAFGGGAHGEGAPVTAVAFHPTDEWTVMAAAGEAPQTDEVEVDAGASGGGGASSAKQSSVASSSSPSLSSPAVYCFDLRASASIVLRSASHRWPGNSDEIAALRISDDGQLLAAADDAGDVRILRFNYAQPEAAEAAAAGTSAAASSASSAFPSASPRRVIAGATPSRTLLGHHTSLCSSTLFRRPRTALSTQGRLSASAARCSLHHRCIPATSPNRPWGRALTGAPTYTHLSTVPPRVYSPSPLSSLLSPSSLSRAVEAALIAAVAVDSSSVCTFAHIVALCGLYLYCT